MGRHGGHSTTKEKPRRRRFQIRETGSDALEALLAEANGYGAREPGPVRDYALRMIRCFTFRNSFGLVMRSSMVSFPVI